MKNKQFLAETGVAGEEMQPTKKARKVRVSKVGAPAEAPISAREAELVRQIAELREMVMNKGEESVPQEKGVRVSGGSQTNFKGQKRYDIRIEMQENESQDVKVGVNGIVFQIWRGLTVTVPECVVDNLRNAVADKLIQIPDPPNPPKNEWHKAQTIPFSILRGPY